MKKRTKREIIEWTALISVFGLLYITGYHTEVIGRVQSLIVATGVLQAEVLAEEERIAANYEMLIKNATGDIHSLEEFKGQNIFMNFWATWCAPCVAEMPDIHNLYVKTKSNTNVRFVMISLDEDFSRAKEFVNEKGYDFPIYSLASPRPSVYRSQSIPTTFIISDEGKIVAQRSGMAKYNTVEIFRLLTQ